MKTILMVFRFKQQPPGAERSNFRVTMNDRSFHRLPIIMTHIDVYTILMDLRYMIQIIKNHSNTFKIQTATNGG